MKQFYTYLHCKPNGEPFYVGKGFGRRARDFINGRNRYHKFITKKYGKENIGIFVFPCFDEAQAFADEIQQIAQLRGKGYHLCNMSDGGEGPTGALHTEEWKASNSLRHKGVKKSEATKALMSAASRGKPKSPEHIKKIGISKLGKKQSQDHIEKRRLKLIGNKSRTGQKASEATKSKMSLSHLGKKFSTVICPHCMKEGSINSMPRWHFDKCKLKGN